MDNASSGRRHAELIGRILRDKKISSRAVAFVHGVVGLIGDRQHARLTRRQVEIATGIDHTRWPIDEAEAAGLWLLDPGSTSVVDGHGMAGTWGVQNAPTSESPSSTSVHLDAEQMSTEGAHSVGAFCTPLPTSDAWQDLGRYRFDGWRLAALLGPGEHQVTRTTLRDLLGLSEDQAKRLLARLKAARLVTAEGVLRTWVAERLDDTAGHDRRAERLTREVRDWTTRRAVLAEAADVVRREGERWVAMPLPQPRTEPVPEVVPW